MPVEAEILPAQISATSPFARKSALKIWLVPKRVRVSV